MGVVRLLGKGCFFHPALLLCAGPTGGAGRELGEARPRGCFRKMSAKTQQQGPRNARSRHGSFPPSRSPPREWSQHEVLVVSARSCAGPACSRFLFPDFLILMRFMKV